ncbi:triose-phosphate isomerase [Desulfatitalea alkaliphila]|uniref:Triosephosphate isomerase n=1 Tax=Desulfatitalea alkaliphila TaxID=2929485 RepID=A0AA41UKC5_9BACT|nr:triose-phosphate isomerase [Desulfatitalea alkaliphila]MCJ8502169.1 triose-phosphate isomerase [Desulfatitalea alkaliphila]
MPTRRPLIAGNWKMHKTGEEAVQTVQQLKSLVADVQDVEVMVAPPFTALAPVAQALAGSTIALGGQNMHWESKGAFTGEIAPGMLVAAGCRYVIIGHSERRQFFGETDTTVNQKIRAALTADLQPVFCIGESEAQREAGQTFSVLDKQVQNGLEGLFSQDLQSLVVAYEPVWAIGTGKTATKEQAQEVHAHVRQLIADTVDKHLAETMRILYGGSVNPGNVKALMAMPDVDGALVGGASLDPETFSQLVHYQG